MVELGALYSLCVSVCLFVCTALFKLHMALLKKVVSPSDCKITK